MADHQGMDPARIARLRNEGIFTPPSIDGTIVCPGQHGGGNWSGAAVSPDGMLYIAGTELPYISSVRTSDGPFGATPSARQFRDERGYPDGETEHRESASSWIANRGSDCTPWDFARRSPHPCSRL